MHAHTSGAAVICLQRWLLELRGRLEAGGVIRTGTRLALIAHRGKPGREASFPTMRDALARILRGSQSPFVCVPTPFFHIRPTYINSFSSNLLMIHVKVHVYTRR